MFSKQTYSIPWLDVQHNHYWTLCSLYDLHWCHSQQDWSHFTEQDQRLECNNKASPCTLQFWYGIYKYTIGKKKTWAWHIKETLLLTFTTRTYSTAVCLTYCWPHYCLIQGNRWGWQINTDIMKIMNINEHKLTYRWTQDSTKQHIIHFMSSLNSTAS